LSRSRLTSWLPCRAPAGLGGRRMSRNTRCRETFAQRVGQVCLEVAQPVGGGDRWHVPQGSAVRRCGPCVRGGVAGSDPTAHPMIVEQGRAVSREANATQAFPMTAHRSRARFWPEWALCPPGAESVPVLQARSSRTSGNLAHACRTAHAWHSSVPRSRASAHRSSDGSTDSASTLRHSGAAPPARTACATIRCPSGAMIAMLL
jgi:hypothetical protein